MAAGHQDSARAVAFAGVARQLVFGDDSVENGRREAGGQAHGHGSRTRTFSGRAIHPAAVPPARKPLATIKNTSANVDSERRVTKAYIRAPQWADDSDVAACTACHTAFSMLVWKHHCRMCGQIFCASCSPHSTPIPAFGLMEPVRVCVLCVSAHLPDSSLLNTSVDKENDSISRNSFRGVQRVLFAESAGSVRPSMGLWLPDSASQTCLQCGTGFGLFTRRHHCRTCGKVRECR